MKYQVPANLFAEDGGLDPLKNTVIHFLIQELAVHAKEITPHDVSRVQQNAVILANIVELACACVKKAAESDMSAALGDDSLNKGVLGSIVANHIQDTLIHA